MKGIKMEKLKIDNYFFEFVKNCSGEITLEVTEEEYYQTECSQKIEIVLEYYSPEFNIRKFEAKYSLRSDELVTLLNIIKDNNILLLNNINEK